MYEKDYPSLVINNQAALSIVHTRYLALYLESEILSRKASIYITRYRIAHETHPLLLFG
jgi:hypothetical protein